MNKITSKDIQPGFRFFHEGIPATVKSISEIGNYAGFVSDDGSESGTIAIKTLVSIINQNK